LNSAERRGRRAFENVCSNFLGNKKSENYVEIVEELLSSYCALGSNMSLKLHFPQSHLHFAWEMWEPSLMSTVKGSIRIYPEWKKDTAANRTQT
jgi:hypothetical protein